MRGCTQCAGVDRPFQVEGELGGVDVQAVFFHHMVESEAFLKGRQRQYVLKRGTGCLQLVDVSLGERGVGDVGRGEAAGIGTSAMGDQGLEHVQPVVGQRPHLVLGDEPARVGPGGLELGAVVGVMRDGVERYGVSERGVRVRARDVGGDHGPGGVGVGAGGDAPEVVEGVLGGGQSGELCLRRVVEVAQQPVARALLRGGADLLLDELQGVSERGAAVPGIRPVRGAGMQPHWVGCGEPARGAGQVGSGGEMFVAPVALQREGDGPVGMAQVWMVAVPARCGQAERGEQQVVDGGVVEAGDPGEKGPRGLGVEYGRVVPGGAVCVLCGVEDQQGRVAECFRPVGELVLEMWVAGTVVDGGRPVPPRGSGGGQRTRGLVSDDLAVSCGEVVEEDAPGDAVDDEVVGDEGEVGRLVGAVVEVEGVEVVGVVGVEVGAGLGGVVGGEVVECFGGGVVGGVDVGEVVGGTHRTHRQDLGGES